MVSLACNSLMTDWGYNTRWKYRKATYAHGIAGNRIVQTSPFGGAETMFFPVPYRITTRSSASLRQPGKYTKATGGNGGWDGDVSHQSFLVPKYPSLYGILCIFVYFHIFKERCYVFVCKGMSQSPAQNVFSKIFNSCKACRR